MEIFVSKAQRARYHRRLRIKIYLYTGFILLLVILAFSAVVHWSFFKIKKFEVSGPVKLEEIKYKVLQNRLSQFLGINNFLSWPSKIGDIQIKKDFFGGTLAVVGSSPERFAIWCAQECYWVNRSGIAVEPAPDTEGASISKINDSRELTPSEGKPVIKENLFANIAKIIDGINSLSLRVKDFDFNERLQELTANGAAGEQLIFSIRFAPSPKAFAYLNDSISSGQLKDAEYLDFTVENRIYLKSH